MLGHEQIYNPDYSALEKLYIFLFGVPIIGLRIRGRNVFSLIPRDRTYRRILDAGCGLGVFSFELGRRFPRAEVLGVDLLDHLVQKCRQIAQRSHTGNVSFRQGSVETLTEENVFDLITCVDLLEHVEDDTSVLRCLHRATVPKGVLVLHVPALYRRYPVWKKSLNFDVETHVRAGYELEAIRERTEKAGYSIREVGYTYGFWETLANNVSYMITRARMQNKGLYAMALPVLYLLSLLGYRARPEKLGAGVFAVAEKRL
jgi:SAM-dependent methyltransferase